MIEIGKTYGSGSIRLSQIAQKQGVSAKYLVHLLGSLKAAGLLRTVRGARGGYLMKSPPSEIKLGQIFRALEGSPGPVECVDDRNACPRSELCVAREVWLRIKDAIRDVLESTTLQDLIDRQTEKQQAQKAMYYI